MSKPKTDNKFIPLDSELLVHERKFWDKESSFLAGIDEAGRGCLAGPVVAAAVVFTDHKRIPSGLNDSKQLTEAKREELRTALLAEPSVKWNVGIISPEEIDRIDILRATWAAMREAVTGVIPPAQFILVDGNPVPDLPLPGINLVHGDALSASIAAASIIAKTTRDHLMVEYEKEYPGYDFAIHKGYGTAEHLAALQKLGVTPIHRKSFGPVKLILNPPEYDQPALF